MLAELASSQPKWPERMSATGSLVAPPDRARVLQWLRKFYSMVEARGAKPMLVTDKYGWQVDEYTGALDWAWNGHATVTTPTGQHAKQLDLKKRVAMPTHREQVLAAQKWRDGVKATVHQCQTEDVGMRRLVVALGLASPIYTAPGSATSSGVVVVRGPNGTGKTTLLNFALTPLAPRARVLVQNASTLNYINTAWSTLGDLSPWIDDPSPTFIRDGHMRELIMQSTTKKQKGRANRDGSLRDCATWQSYCVVGTNENPDEWCGFDSSSGATRRRMLVIPITSKLSYGGSRFAEMSTDVELSLADWWPQRVMLHKDSLTSRMTHWRNMLQQHTSQGADVSVPLDILASVFVATELAHQDGLLLWTTDDIMGAAIEVLRQFDTSMVKLTDQSGTAIAAALFHRMHRNVTHVSAAGHITMPLSGEGTLLEVAIDKNTSRYFIAEVELRRLRDTQSIRLVPTGPVETIYGTGPMMWVPLDVGVPKLHALPAATAVH